MSIDLLVTMREIILIDRAVRSFIDGDSNCILLACFFPILVALHAWRITNIFC